MSSFSEWRQKYKEIIKKLMITIGIIVIYKILMLIPLFGINSKLLLNSFISENGLLNTMNTLSGDSLSNCGILCINITPYINASIITQVLSSNYGFDFFRNLKKDRELGSLKLNEWTKYFTIIIAVLHAVYFLVQLTNQANVNIGLIYVDYSLFYLVNIIVLCAGSLLTVWISNQITRHGIGQGVSLIIFVNILSGFVTKYSNIKEAFTKGFLTNQSLALLIGFLTSITLLSVFVEYCQKKIPVVYLGNTQKNSLNFLPLKINNAGVIPPIMASTFANFPLIILEGLKKFKLFTDSINKYIGYFSPGGSFYYGFLTFLITIFVINHTDLVLDPEEMATNLQDNNIIIKDVRPGDDTKNFLKNTIAHLNLLTLPYMILLCVVTEYFCFKFNEHVGFNVISTAGTTILIVVSITEIVFKNFVYYDYESTMAHYKSNSNKKIDLG